MARRRGILGDPGGLFGLDGLRGFRSGAVCCTVKVCRKSARTDIVAVIYVKNKYQKYVVTGCHYLESTTLHHKPDIPQRLQFLDFYIVMWRTNMMVTN